MALEEWLGLDYDRPSLLANIVHDMKSLEYTTGRPVLKRGDVTSLKDALDSATVGPMMALEAPRFYREVALPLAKRAANPVVFQINPETGQAMDGSQHRWTVVYDWLLLRVLAHYTHDPTFIRWFQEERNPLTELGQVLELSPEQSVAFLLWLCCGEDEALLSSLYPNWAALLPASPQLVKAARADKHLPTLRMGLIQLLNQCSAERRAQTLYVRCSPWGRRPEELLHFTLLGTVNDLLDVAVASLLLNCSPVHWLLREGESKYNHFLRVVIAGYSQVEPQTWQQLLEELAPLNNPLGMVALAPRVAVE
jgi:hypothetical protein